MPKKTCIVQIKSGLSLQIRPSALDQFDSKEEAKEMGAFLIRSLFEYHKNSIDGGIRGCLHDEPDSRFGDFFHKKLSKYQQQHYNSAPLPTDHLLWPNLTYMFQRKDEHYIQASLYYDA